MNRNSNMGGILIIALIIIIAVVAMIYKNYLRSLPQDYTNGEIIRIWKPVKGGVSVSYKYKVNNKFYENSVDLHGFEDVAEIGKFFLVEFPEDHPEAGVMLLNHPMPKNIQVPSKGWDKNPTSNF